MTVSLYNDITAFGLAIRWPMVRGFPPKPFVLLFRGIRRISFLSQWQFGFQSRYSPTLGVLRCSVSLANSSSAFGIAILQALVAQGVRFLSTTRIRYLAFYLGTLSSLSCFGFAIQQPERRNMRFQRREAHHADSAPSVPPVKPSTDSGANG